MELTFLLALTALPLAQAETVLGVYIFHRHGDRTSKITSPVNLTVLGASQVFDSGNFYRERYVASGAPQHILGFSDEVAVPDQMHFMSPEDPVLQSSAQIFFQGLYPPLGALSSAETLANGSQVIAPMAGRQYVAVNVDDMAASTKQSESKPMLQSGSGCGKALASSKAYYDTKEYRDRFLQSDDFYHEVLPAIEPAFNKRTASFENAYTIWDYINVNLIHNTTYLDSDPVTDTQLALLKFLANTHEWSLAYNASEPIRAIAGSLLAGHILDALEPIVQGNPSAPKMNIQFGAYATFLSFFGLADLPAYDSIRFKSIVDYASSMVFELYRDNLGDVRVRFFFANGEASRVGLRQVPLFGQEVMNLAWPDFEAGMTKFAVRDRKAWCEACGETTGVCSLYDTLSNGSPSSGNGSNGISTVVAGVIGAIVTLVVILGIQTLVMLLGGLKVVKKSVLRNMILVEKLDDA